MGLHSGETFIAVTTGSTFWSYTVPFTWTSDKRYLVRSQATDGPANQESAGAGISFVIDSAGPVSAVTFRPMPHLSMR